MPPHSNNATAELAKACTVMLIPTGTTLDDLVPTVKLMHQLVKAGMTASRLAAIMVRSVESEAQVEAAHTFITEAGCPTHGSLLAMGGIGSAIDFLHAGCAQAISLERR